MGGQTGLALGRATFSGLWLRSKVFAPDLDLLTLRVAPTFSRPVKKRPIPMSERERKSKPREKSRRRSKESADVLEPSKSRVRKERSHDGPSREGRPEKSKSKAHPSRRHDSKREQDPPNDGLDDPPQESQVKVIAMPPPKKGRRGKRSAQRMIITKSE